MSQNWLAVIIAYVYVFAAIGVAGVLQKWRSYSIDFTRKVVHISVGMWSYGTVLLFEDRLFAIIPPASFVILNAISYFKGTFKAIESGEEGQLGTIYFPIAFATIVWFFWEQPHLVVAGLMTMTWGDAMAAVIGKRYGKRKYTIFGGTRSIEGSVTMFVVSTIATVIPLLFLAPEPIALGTAVLMASVAALGATAFEAVAPKGSDNLLVPAMTIGLLILLHP